jgi:hypothetical protein
MKYIRVTLLYPSPAHGGGEDGRRSAPGPLWKQAEALRQRPEHGDLGRHVVGLSILIWIGTRSNYGSPVKSHLNLRPDKWFKIVKPDPIIRRERWQLWEPKLSILIMVCLVSNLHSGYSFILSQGRESVENLGGRSCLPICWQLRGARRAGKASEAT